ncbi:ferritin-like domain-containing protein [Microvirga sp. CF3016]|uniref:ferritin-like domain-containing protein n=1 Tax=Microvirga sp. CF3016 TaxID=3110181 RepID=UPI002E7781F3|nr:ferritin family protein [Microvirga sp. CF3016]MEE1609872.1 ferritin family protein [Microvirga sp. CF3016]
MSLLKSELADPVKSLEELFAIAAAMEQEAATRYAEIAARMRQEGNPALAEVFEHLSADEQGHLDSVMDWSQRTRGQAPNPARIRWTLPETFNDEGAATTDPKLVSAYRALSMAVRNEERAFAFWSYVAAHAETPEIRAAAEAMAHEELGHVATLRRERRQAFHAERRHLEASGDEKQPNLAALEGRLAALLEPLAAEVPPYERARLTEFAAEARRHAKELEQSPIPVGRGAPVPGFPDDPVALAELLADRYLAAGDASHDEATLERIQGLAGRAIGRLAWLRADLPELREA